MNVVARYAANQPPADCAGHCGLVRIVRGCVSTPSCKYGCSYARQYVFFHHFHLLLVVVSVFDRFKHHFSVFLKFSQSTKCIELNLTFPITFPHYHDQVGPNMGEDGKKTVQHLNPSHEPE